MSAKLVPAVDPSRVYIVDDDAAVRSALSMLVDTCGWEAVPCASAEEFFARYAPGANQCLILDLRMPGRGGAEIQSELARLDDRLPIILVTAHSDLPEAQAVKNRGAVAVFGKPFNSTELLDCVRRTLDDVSPDGQQRSG